MTENGKITNRDRLGFIRGKIGSDRNWAIRALVVIYGNQTNDEKNQGVAIHNNRIGFSSLDSKILTELANFYLSRNFLTDKQMQIVFSRIRKYASQILHLSDLEKLDPMIEKEFQINPKPKKGSKSEQPAQI